MTLPAWWQVVTPHRDIREKSFSEAVFAADLGEVMRGTAPEEYRDPRLFFAKTYLTAGLKNLVRNVLERLTTGRGDPVIQLQTPFGGGKTHALITLYHLVKSFPEISHLDQVKELVAGFAGFSGVRVAAFMGTAADPIKGKTPWGEIAYQLGCYDVVREHDEKRVAPGKDRVREMLQRCGPALILMDELLAYVTKANRMEKVEQIALGQTLVFLQELTEAVASSENSVLVLTLPASILERYDEEAEKAFTQLQKVSGRVESIYVPVEGVEIYEVVRKRLFEQLGDREVHRRVAEEYFKLYQALGTDVPREVREIAYREKIERAYPFHPEFIDVLYERWGSFPTFQRTRGVLQLLAHVVSDLYTRKVSSPLIQSSLVDLGYTPVRLEFLRHIGNEYDSIITADITGKAAQIDREMGSEYEKYGIARGLATAVFLYSFSGGERRGVTLPWLRVALLREGVPSTIVGDAVTKLDETLWFFHREKHLYSFKNQPNLNRVIVEKEEAVEADRIRETLREQLSKITKGAPCDVYLWPQRSEDIPDSKRLKIVFLEPELRYGRQETEDFARDLLDNVGDTFRIYRNTLFVVSVDPGAYSELEWSLRRFIALQEIAQDKGLSLTPNAREEVQTKLKQAEKDLPSRVVAAYRHVAWYGNGGVIWRDMGLPTDGAEHLGNRVFRYLKDEDRILFSVTPKLVLERALGKGEAEKSVQEIYELFLKTPGLPCLESENVLVEAIKQGVKNRLLGLRVGERLYFDEAVPDVPLNALVLRPEKAAAEKEAEAVVTPRGEMGGYPPGGEQAEPGTRPDSVIKEEQSGFLTPHRVTQVAIKAVVPYDKLSLLIRGVISPLKTADSVPEITIEIRARSASGFDRTTLDSKVKETLQQMGAEIKEWEEN